MEDVISYCHENLRKDRALMQYAIEERGLSASTINKFKVGAFPVEGQALFDMYEKIKTNLHAEKSVLRYDGSYFESKFILNRFIIPIYNSAGQAQGIMGRFYGSEDARKASGLEKYYNTHYKKRSCLFGLNLAKQSILSTGEVVIMEGNMDVITAHQHGVTNVVGTSHSSVSYRQLLLAARYAKRIYLCLDNDEAGREGTLTALKRYGGKIVESLGATLETITLPSEFKDADTYLRSDKWI
jgi:DNA primase